MTSLSSLSCSLLVHRHVTVFFFFAACVRGLMFSIFSLFHLSPFFFPFIFLRDRAIALEDCFAVETFDWIFIFFFPY